MLNLILILVSSVFNMMFYVNAYVKYEALSLWTSLVASNAMRIYFSLNMILFKVKIKNFWPDFVFFKDTIVWWSLSTPAENLYLKVGLFFFS